MDNHHVTISSAQMSCGVRELSRIEADISKVIYAIASDLYHPSRGTPAAFVSWSDLESSNGANLANALFKKYPGSLAKTAFVENPKTSNAIAVWVWAIPHEEFRKYYVEERVKRASKI